MSRMILVVLMALTAVAAPADVVHFDNGDRLTGTSVQAEPGFIAIDVPRVGVVTIPEALVARVQTDAADVSAVASTEEILVTPAPAEQSPVSKLIDVWDVAVDLAMTSATGNTETSDFNLVARATRTGERFDHVLGTLWHQGKTEHVLAKDQLDVNYDLRWKYGASWDAGANFEDFRDPIKDIDQRYTAGAGFGHTFWTSSRGSLSTDGGVSQVFEHLASVTQASKSDHPALRWSLSYQHWLVPDRLEAFHNNQVLHILASDRGTVWDSDTGLRLHVNSRWQAGLRLDLQHETAPVAGRGKTDAAYAVSFGVKL